MPRNQARKYCTGFELKRRRLGAKSSRYCLIGPLVLANFTSVLLAHPSEMRFVNCPDFADCNQCENVFYGILFSFGSHVLGGILGLGLLQKLRLLELKLKRASEVMPNILVRLQPDPFLNELTNMFERTTEKGSVWVTLKHSSDKSKVQRNKMKTAGEKIEYRCLIRATDSKKTISTMVGAKDHQRFQSSYATILKARMTALKKRERKDKRKAADSDKKADSKKRSSAAKKTTK
ncbi:Signal recognition particle protein [Sesamum angolense]|uniref:Signal recognition particle 14 kDa protein n=1 Tax=Sesamum angolense TaxID=2727404 RepID=A0AAE2BWD2_9LAMI|nr:Signal recognition particle protein [Sesamum angolense]